MKSNGVKSPYLTGEEAASYLRVSETHLVRWRRRSTGPPYHQPGGPGTKVLYRVRDLEAWVEGNRAAEDLAEIATQQ